MCITATAKGVSQLHLLDSPKKQPAMNIRVPFKLHHVSSPHIYIYICFYIYIYIYIYINKQDLVFVALLCCYSVVATFGVFIQTVKEETLGESGRDREKDRHQKYTPQWLMSLADTAQANAPSLPKWTFWICCVQMFNLFSCLGGFIRLDSSGCICCSD